MRAVQNLPRIAVAAAVALFMASAASAADSTLQTASGKVASVDVKASAVSMTVAGEAGAPSKTMKVTVDKETKIVKDGKSISLGDLQPGDEVVVSYRMAGAATIAVNIGVQSQPS